MIFRLAISEYDAHTERGYVEFRANDGDGGMIISCILKRSEVLTSAPATPGA